MKISVDDKELYMLSEVQKRVICNDIHSDLFEEDLKRRVEYVLKHKYEQCLKRLVDEWMPKLKQRVASLPTNDDELAQLIISQPDYKCRRMREEESKANNKE